MRCVQSALAWFGLLRRSTFSIFSGNLPRRKKAPSSSHTMMCHSGSFCSTALFQSSLRLHTCAAFAFRRALYSVGCTALHFFFLHPGAQGHRSVRQLHSTSWQGRKTISHFLRTHFQLLTFVQHGSVLLKLITRHALLSIPCCFGQHCEARSPRTLYKMQKLVQFISPVPSCSHILFFAFGQATRLTYCSLFMPLLSLPSLLFASACPQIKAAPCWICLPLLGKLLSLAMQRISIKISKVYI